MANVVGITGVYVEGPEEPTEISINEIMQIVEEGGVDALTDEEFAAYRAATSTQVLVHEEFDKHEANLAHYLSEENPGFLRDIAHKVIENARRDEESRADWRKMEQQAIQLLGVSPDVWPSADFEGASDAIHPLFAEAVLQFVSRAMRVLWPPGGPVKAEPLGQYTEEKLARAQRVEQHMNWHLTHKLRGAREKHRKMLVRLAMSGSMFSKPYYDYTRGVVDRKTIAPEHMLVPWTADSLDDAQRYTEICLMPRNDVKKLMTNGFFIDCDLARPSEDQSTDVVQSARELEDAIKLTEGREKTVYADDTDRHSVLFQAINLVVPGDEDKKGGEQTDVELPYLAVVDVASQRTLHLSRLWRESDPLKQRVCEYAHYKMMSGLGFYGYGFYHWLGGLFRGATGAFRSILDAAGFENLKGGFKSEDLKIKGDSVRVGHGEFHDVEWPGEGRLQDQMVVLNYGGPSPVLYQMLGDMVEWGRRVLGITDAVVGEGTSTVPVGTQLSRVEQGQMLATEIHQGIHDEQAIEMRRLAEVMYLYGDEEYAYDVPNERRIIKRSDFDPTRVSISLVTNPQQGSALQRYFVSEAALNMAARNPEVYDIRELHRRALSALQLDDVDKLVPNPEKMVVRMDPVTENAQMLMGRPVKAFIDQEHAAHIATHESALQTLSRDQATISAGIQAHIQEHMALQYLRDMSEQTGIVFELPDQQAMSAGEMMDADPLMENEIAVLAAQAAERMAAMREPPPDYEAMEFEREQARKDQAAAADNARRDAMAEASIERANVQSTTKGAIETEAKTMEQRRKDAIAEHEIRRQNLQDAEKMLVQNAQAQTDRDQLG